MSELPRSALGADPGVQARVNDTAVLIERWPLMIDPAMRTIELPSQAIDLDRATRGGALSATRPAGEGGRLLFHRTDGDAELGAAGTGVPDARRCLGRC